LLMTMTENCVETSRDQVSRLKTCLLMTKTENCVETSRDQVSSLENSM